MRTLPPFSFSVGGKSLKRRRLSPMKYPDLLVLRHGETVWNQLGKFQGRKDSPLTQKGQTQALRQNALLAKVRNPPLAKYCSPQGRAVQTARLALGSDDGLILDKRLQEIDFGEWEGATRDEILAKIDYPFDSGLWNFRSPNGESFGAITERVESFLNDLGEPAIIVTHGITSIVLRGLYLGLNQPEILKLPRDQGSIYQLSNGVETIWR
jgi:broad specificity phosphatase PhoE